MLLDSRGGRGLLRRARLVYRVDEGSLLEHVSFRINGTFDETVSPGYLRGLIVPPRPVSPSLVLFPIPDPLSPTPPLGR